MIDFERNCRIYLLCFFTCTSISLSGTNSEKIALWANPSEKVIEGNYLQLSCTVDDQIFAVIWKKDGEELAENCRFFKNHSRYNCIKEKNSFNFVITATERTDAGIWKCTYGPRIWSSLAIQVVVPAYLDPPKIIPVGPVDTTTVLTAAQKQNNQRTNIVEDKPRLIGTGTLEDPIDLTGRVPNSVTELIIQSQSTCASVKHDLQWRCENSTRSFSLRPSVVQAIPDTGTRRLGTLSFAPQLPCPNGLYSITGQVRIGCDSRMKTSSSSDRGTRENALVGLNRIKCTPNHGRDQAFIDQTFSREAANLYAQRISSMQLTSSGFYDDCLPIDPTQRNKQRSACVYVLCPGPVEPWFTLSERVAIAVSVPVFILLCLLLCYVTQRRRRSKQKSNLAPGQNHEIELML